MRRSAALIVTAGLIVTTLAGCAPSSESVASCEAPYSAGKASEAVSASGDFGSAPEVDVPSPLLAKKTQVSTLIEGTGPGLETGQLISAEVTVVDGGTGEVLEQSSYDGSQPLQLVAGSANQIAGLTNALLCAQVDSRIAIAIAPDDGASQFGLADGASLVVVLDIDSAYPARADGAPQVAQNGFPTVTLDDTGRPGLVVPNGDAPTELKVADLKKGDGPRVQEGDQVVVNYTGWLWSTGETFDSSWESGTPAVFPASADSVVSGFADALIGATVGSQVIAIIPPAEGYGDQAQGSIPAGSTLVFVVDVLGIQE